MSALSEPVANLGASFLHDTNGGVHADVHHHKEKPYRVHGGPIQHSGWSPYELNGGSVLAIGAGKTIHFSYFLFLIYVSFFFFLVLA